MLPQVMLLATLFSCSKEDSLQSPESEAGSVQVQQEALAAMAPSTHLYYEETFEGSQPLGDIHLQKSTSYGFTVASSPVFSGSKSGRFELRDSDPEASGGTRAEVLGPEISGDLNRWYAFSVYFPSSDYAPDSHPELISQWNQGGGISGAIEMDILSDRFRFQVCATLNNKKQYDLGVVTKNTWHTFVFHIKHSNSSDGLVEVWHNGVKKVTHTGDNMFTTAEHSGVSANPRWKYGIYKWRWNGSKTTDTKKRVLYFDDVRIGKASATYAVMTAGGSTSTTPPPTTTTPPTTAPSSITGFTLVNSGTEQDIMAISNGAVINLAKLGASKLNIRANGVSSGSVKFELSGKQSKIYTDMTAPYALHGDDGRGNYYYGNWNPPALGTYTLKATTSTGATSSITFTFINDASAGLVSITPPTTTTPPATTSPITSFTLVNAGTERDVMTISNGATIRLSQISDSRLNIRANGVSSGSVKFELSGKQSKIYTDMTAPYSLHGDDRYGNYYYGNWNPPALGTYTLKATPANGSPYTITFTITS